MRSLLAIPARAAARARSDHMDRRTLAGNGSPARRATACRHTRADERTVWLWVDDDGPGIPAADRGWVFDHFTRLDDGRAGEDGGAGLGLAVVRAIVTRRGGSARPAPARSAAPDCSSPGLARHQHS